MHKYTDRKRQALNIMYRIEIINQETIDREWLAYSSCIRQNSRHNHKRRYIVHRATRSGRCSNIASRNENTLQHNTQLTVHCRTATNSVTGLFKGGSVKYPATPPSYPCHSVVENVSPISISRFFSVIECDFDSTAPERTRTVFVCRERRGGERVNLWSLTRRLCMSQ